MKEFQKQREENTRIHPGEMFKQSWDDSVIEQELKRARNDRDLPIFGLDKVEMHPSKICDLACSWCYGRDVVPELSQRENLPYRVAIGVLKDIRENMPSQNPLIVYAGLYSEPSLNKDFPKIIEETGKMGFRFGVYTHGLLMTPELAEVIAKSAMNTKDSRPSYVSFNLTAMFDSKRKSHLERLVGGINSLDESRKRNKSSLLLNGSLIASNEDFSSYERILEETKKAGIDNIRFAFPFSAQKNEANQHFGGLTGKQYHQFSEEFLRLKEKHPDLVSIRYPPRKLFDKCFVGTQALSISSEGDVFLCPEVSSLLFKKTHSYGNIHEKPISQIWHSDAHKALFLKFDPYTVEKKCVCCHMDEEINRHCANYWPPTE